MIVRAVLRHVLRNPAQWIGGLVLVALAVAVYAGTFMGMDRVAATTDQLYDELRMFDLEVRVTPTSRPKVPNEAAIAEIPGVEAATWRVKARGTLERPDGGVTAAAVFTASPIARPAVSDVRLTAGEWLQKGRPEGVVVDHSFARDHGLKVGDRLTARAMRLKFEAEIVGIGILPEHLLSSVDENFTVPVRGSLAAIVVSEELAFRRMIDKYPVNDLAIRLARDADRAEVLAALEDRLDVEQVTWRDQQYSVMCNRNRLRALRDILPATVGVFDGVALVLIFLAFGRLARSWREAMGTLSAFGIGAGRLLGAWLIALAILLAAGAAIGAIGAVGLAEVTAQAYLQSTGFPILLTSVTYGPLAEALALAAVMAPVGLIAVWLELARPATELLRPPVTASSGWLRVAMVVLAPLTALFGAAESLGLRNALRRPSAFVVSVVSVAGTLVMAASMYVLGQAQFDNMTSYSESRRWDAAVTLHGERSDDALRELLTEAGATGVEPLVSKVATLTVRGVDLEHRLIGGPVPSELQGDEWLVMGRPLEPGADELLLGFRQFQELGAEVGDRLEVKDGERVLGELELVGVINGFQRGRAYVDRVTLERLVGEPLEPAAALVSGPDAMTATLIGHPQVVTALDGRLIRQATLDGAGAFVRIVRIYGHAGAVAALVVLMASLLTAVRERASELAALRSQGLSMGFLGRAILAEAVLVAAIGGVLALPFTRLATRAFQHRIAVSDGIYVPLDDTSLLLALSLVAPVAFVALGAVPIATRVAARLPLASSLSARRR